MNGQYYAGQSVRVQAGEVARCYGRVLWASPASELVRVDVCDSRRHAWVPCWLNARDLEPLNKGGM